jgi:hypothetical protein
MASLRHESAACVPRVTRRLCTSDGFDSDISPPPGRPAAFGSPPPSNHQATSDVNHVTVIAMAMRERANREPRCIFALVFAAGSAL